MNTLNSNTEELSVVLKCLHYFDIFKHPLNGSEIHRFSSEAYSQEKISHSLDTLVNNGAIELFEGYYAISDAKQKVEERLIKEKAAIELESIAMRNAILIARFPFNLCVCISGSLSKGVIGSDGDIDYFIIAKPGRVWISKFFLKFYKVLFLKNSKDHFCINYIITTDSLEIKEKNLFTATEIETLLLLVNQTIYDRFIESNQWFRNFLPNGRREGYDKMSIKQHFDKLLWSRFIEWILDNRLGDMLNDKFKKIAANRNNKKYRTNLTKEEYDLMFRSESDEAKVHPPNYQGKVLDLYNEKIKTIVSH